MLNTTAVKIEVILYYWGNNNKGQIYMSLVQNIFVLNIFNVWLVKFMDVECMDIDG